MKPNIHIIILHFGDWQITRNCLDSLSKIIHSNFNYQTILVNNSLKKLPPHSAIDFLITPDKNLGFADGNNLAIQKSQSFHPTHYLFLNNDTIVEPDFLENLLKNLPEPNCLAGPILEHLVKKQTFYDYGGFIHWHKTQAKHINQIQYIKSKPEKRDFVSGCCLLINKTIIDQIGGFQSNYFLYLEDVELCLRAAKHNYSTYIIPSSKIFHLGSQSSTEFTKIFYSLKNSLKLIHKYTPAKYKFQSYLFNLTFYPSIFILWQLKKIKQKLFQKNSLS